MAGQIGDENAVACGKRRRERTPVLDRPPKSVHKYERRDLVAGRPADGVVESRSPPFELALLEPGEPLFALRRH